MVLMRNLSLFAMIAFALVFGPRTAPAQMVPPGLPPGYKFVQVELTKARIKGVLVSMAAIKDLSRKYGGARKPNAGKRDPVAALTGFLHHPAARSEMKQLVFRQGFKTLTAWANTLRTMMIFYVVVTSGQNLETLRAKTRIMYETLKENPNLLPEQRDLMLKPLQQSIGFIAVMKASPASLAVVREMHGEITASMAAMGPGRR